jgi:hypothetical protein
MGEKTVEPLIYGLNEFALAQNAVDVQVNGEEKNPHQTGRRWLMGVRQKGVEMIERAPCSPHIFIVANLMPRKKKTPISRGTFANGGMSDLG